LLTAIRLETFCPYPKTLNGFTPAIIANHSVKINKQLFSKFDAKRKFNINLGRGLRSSVVDDLLEADVTGKNLQHHQLSRYVIDDVIISEEGTPFLLCTTLNMDEERFDGLLKQSTKGMPLSLHG